MAQSRKMSAVEAALNTFGGFSVALGAQVVIFPLFGIHISLVSSVEIAVCMMVQSLIRQYTFRRFFVWLDRPATPEAWDNPDWKTLENNEEIVRLGQH